VGSQLWTTILDTEFNGLTISGLTSQEDYEWRVRSDCSTGASSDFSPLATFTTSSATNLVAGQNFNINLDPDNNLASQRGVSEDGAVEDVAQLADEQSIALMNVDLYPNPFRDKVNLVINNPNDANATISMFNLAGLRIMDIFDGGLSAGQSYGFMIDGSTLTNGIYMIVINGVGDQRMVKRVMLKR
jgi:hypothetical protein